MQQYAFVAIVFGAVAVFLANASTTAYYVSCPPNDALEASTSLRHLCSFIEQAVNDNVVIQDEPFRRIVGRNVNPNTKRQDVDHVFLRFGRPFGL
ncbi:uncharacterized protein LOC135267220 [Tribolium castaneum]|uniref:Myosuppressin n=1 Tax=Tribolium castaneum TaxID=7070 RepID=D7EIL9_TRICA|nr:myosuppressin [Tribolium castaneum]